MTLAANLSLASFADLIALETISFNLMFHQELSRAGSELLAADLAPGSWQFDATSVPYAHADAKLLLAIINSRKGALQTFLFSDKSKLYPVADPTGSIFGAATPVVGTITDRSTVAFTGFPAGYVVTAGDYFQILYDTSRYYLGQFTETKTASGGGAISATTVTPTLPDLIVGGEAVTVIKPAAKFRITQAHIETTNAVISTIAITAEQTGTQ